MNKEFHQEVVNLFNRFVNDLDENMYYSMQKKGDVVLQAPQFIIDILYQSLQATYMVNPTENTTGHLVFQGLELQPTYEMAIILFHKQYPLYKNDWMLKKISLEPGLTIKKEWYSETGFKMKEFFGLGGSNPSDN